MREGDFSRKYDNGDPEPDRYTCDYMLMSRQKCGKDAVLGIPKFHGSSKGRGKHEYRFACEVHRDLFVEKDWRDEALEKRMKEDEQKLIERFGADKVKEMSGYDKFRALLGSLPKALNSLARKP